MKFVEIRHSFRAWPRTGPPLPTDIIIRIEYPADTVSALSAAFFAAAAGEGALHLVVRMFVGHCSPTRGQAQKL